MAKDDAVKYLDAYGPSIDPKILAQRALAPAAPDVVSSADAGAHDLVMTNPGQTPEARAYQIANAPPGSPRPPPAPPMELHHTATTLRAAREKKAILDAGVRDATKAGAVFATPASDANAGAPSGPPRLISPGKWELAIDPARAQEYGTGVTEQREGLAAEGAAESAGMDKLAEAERIHGEDLAIAKGKKKLADEEKDRQIEEHEAKINQFNEDYARGEIDPEHFWASRSMPQKVLAIASLAAGGFLQGFRGGPNPAQQMLDQAIDRDIAAQRANLEKKGKNIEHERGLLADAYRRFGRMDAAEDAARMVMEQEYAGKLRQIGAETNSPLVQARIKQQLGQLDQRTALARQGMEKYAQPIYSGGGPGALGHVKDQGTVFMGPDGQRYAARDAPSRKKLADAVAANADMKQTLAAYEAANNKLSTVDRASLKLGTPTPAAAQANALYYTALSKERQLQNDGVYKKSEEPMFPKILLPPDRMLGSSKGQVQAAMRHADQELTSTIRAEDPLPVKQEFGPKGPHADYTGGTYQPPTQQQQPQGNPSWFKP